MTQDIDEVKRKFEKLYADFRDFNESVNGLEKKQMLKISVECMENAFKGVEIYLTREDK